MMYAALCLFLVQLVTLFIPVYTRLRPTLVSTTHQLLGVIFLTASGYYDLAFIVYIVMVFIAAADMEGWFVPRKDI